MSRDEAHGGGEWAFPKCVWSPTEKEGGGKWAFWSKIHNVKIGDTILHLRGIPPNAYFVGYSTASSDGYETPERPPDPGGWSYSGKFLRADLEEFTPFESPINLSQVFSVRKAPLTDYFEANKARRRAKLNIFFVRQSGRLQCLNGAYLSDVDEELLTALFGITPLGLTSQGPVVSISVITGQQLAVVQARQGQGVFSKNVRALYGNACCFPYCTAMDARFLVASHIARWSDNKTLRGHLGNGLCLCLMHDKAFELGLFTLDENLRVYINPSAVLLDTSFKAQLQSAHGQQIRASTVAPLSEALAEHWARVNLRPMW